jgi:hypothetical protein
MEIETDEGMDPSSESPRETASSSTAFEVVLEAGAYGRGGHDEPGEV